MKTGLHRTTKGGWRWPRHSGSHSRWRTILKLTCNVSGTNSSTFDEFNSKTGRHRTTKGGWRWPQRSASHSRWWTILKLIPSVSGTNLSTFDELKPKIGRHRTTKGGWRWPQHSRQRRPKPGMRSSRATRCRCACSHLTECLYQSVLVLFISFVYVSID